MILSLVASLSCLAEEPAEALETLKASYQKSGGWDLKYGAFKEDELKANIILAVSKDRRHSALQFKLLNQGVSQGFGNYPAPGDRKANAFMIAAGNKIRLPQFSELLKVTQRVDRDAKISKSSFFQPSITIEGSDLIAGGAISSSIPYPWLRSSKEVERFNRVSRKEGIVTFESAGVMKALFEEKSGLLLEYYFDDPEGRSIKLLTRKPLEKFDAAKHAIHAPEQNNATANTVVMGMFIQQQFILTTRVLSHLIALDKNEQQRALERYRAGMVDYYEKISGDFPSLRGPAKLVKALEEASQKSFQNTLEKYLANGATKAEILTQRETVNKKFVLEIAPVISKKIPDDKLRALDPTNYPEPQKSLLISINRNHRLAIIQSILQTSNNEQFDKLAQEIANEKN